MTTDLFSSLDGCGSYTSWAVPILFCWLFLSNYTFINSTPMNMTLLASSVWSGVSSPFCTAKLMLMSVFIFLISNNLVGLSPFTFGITSSLWVNTSMAMLFWGLFLLSGWVYSFKASMGHLAPSGAPLALMPFLILIESISILIRPVTLSVRLMANMSAGHIVLGLMSNVLSSSVGFVSGLFLLVLMLMYYMFEFFVSVIQAYIFTLLISLYSLEHPTT